MISTKAAFISLILAVSALSLADDTIKIGNHWTKDQKYKIKFKSEFEVSGMSATIDGLAVAYRLDRGPCELKRFAQAANRYAVDTGCRVRRTR